MHSLKIYDYCAYFYSLLYSNYSRVRRIYNGIIHYRPYYLPNVLQTADFSVLTFHLCLIRKIYFSLLSLIIGSIIVLIKTRQQSWISA